MSSCATGLPAIVDSNQAAATKRSLLSAISENLQPSEFVCSERIERFAPSDVGLDLTRSVAGHR